MLLLLGVTQAAARPLSLPYQLDWNGEVWIFQAGKSFQGTVLLEDLENGLVLEALEMRPGQTWKLSSLDLQPGRQYRLRGESPSGRLGGLTFRALSRVEQELLVGLLNQDSGPGLERMDAFASLGLFHLAVKEAERLLSLSHSPQRPALWQAIYDLNLTVLQDQKAAQDCLDRAKLEGVRLQP